MNYLIPGPNLARARAVEPLIAAAVQAGHHLTLSITLNDSTENDLGVRTEQYTVQLDVAAPPSANGWSFIASFTVDENGIATTRHIPDKGLPLELTSVAVCDHCGVNFGRRPMVVLRSLADGRCMRVGRDCLIDLLGPTARAAADYAEQLMAIDQRLRSLEFDDFITLDAAHHDYHLEKYLAVVAAAIEQVGWVSRKESAATGKPATADFALDIVLANRVIGISEAARAKVVAALTWARQLKSEDRNLDSYELKLANLAAQPYINAADCGLAASMLMACDQAARRAVEARYPNRPSEPIGQIDERGTFTLEVVEVRPIGDGPEAKLLHKFVDPAGNRAAWFASTGRALEVGQVYQIRGTVKAHRPYRDVMETILTRCQVQPATPDQAALGI